MIDDIQALVNSIPIADTHEHLVEEKRRLDPQDKDLVTDIGSLFVQYVDSDLIVAGMPKDHFDVLKKASVDPERKWNLVRPWWPFVRTTGYGRMVRESVRFLFEEDDVTDANWKQIDEGLRCLPAPGYYRALLQDRCRIDHCQVNALDDPVFRESNDPEFLKMDLCVSFLCSDFDPPIFRRFLDRDPQGFDDYIEAIDRAYAQLGPKAVAVKNQTAYRRRIDYESRALEEAKSCFDHCSKKNWTGTREERKPLEDFLVHYTIKKAAEFGLPYKMHTGFHAGHSTMPLNWVRKNAGDMADLCRQHPEAKFVIFHITYPYQDEAIALAKHYPNAYIDMCWSWMINPVAAVRFLKEYLLAAPSNKILVFGGDVSYVELVPGHLKVARDGIARAVYELVRDGWIDYVHVPDLLERLLYKNACDLFPLGR